MSPNSFDNLPVLQKLAGAEDVVISVLVRPQVSENRIIVGLGLKASQVLDFGRQATSTTSHQIG